MNEREKDDLSPGISENESNTKSEECQSYCGVCFIAFGSQEKRITLNKTAVHPDCAKKMNLEF